MEYRSLSLAAGLIVCSLSGLPARAEDGPSEQQQADWQQRLDKAVALQAEGRARRDSASRAFELREAECFKRILVNDCRSQAEADYLSASHQGERLENEGKALEREVRKEKHADQDRRRAAEASQRAAERPSRAAQTSAESAAHEARVAEIRADKAKKAEAGAQRKAAEAEKLRKKQAEHAARVAGKKAKAAPQTPIAQPAN